MRRILFLIPSLQYSGTAKQATLLACQLPQDRFETCVAVLGAAGPLTEPLVSAGVHVERLGWKRFFDVTPFWWLRRLVKEFQPDVIHAWGVQSLRALRIAYSLGGRRSVRSAIVASRCLPAPRGKTDALVDRLLGFADRWVASHPGEITGYRRRGVPAENIVHIPPGVAVPTAHCPLPTAHLLLSIGPIERRKGFRDAIWAFDILRFLYDDLQLVIAGNGPDLPRLKEFARAIQATDQVHFPGPPDVSSLLRQATVVWVPSTAEGGQQVALEAMAAGRPVVASRLPGLAELIIDGQTGYLVPAGDKVGRAKQTRRLLDNPELARVMGEAGRRRVLQHFSIDQLVHRVGNLYDALVAERPTSHVLARNDGSSLTSSQPRQPLAAASRAWR
ncbi:MAG TPA: glycosyltransferase [Gemmataceae bacterium]|nr:glycosyltransferase [Gemmataceae bacterium]